ncbi:hypothetical protein BGZ81_003394, partial [Podila clonocystis]
GENGKVNAPFDSISNNLDQQNERNQQQSQSDPVATILLTPTEGPVKENQPVAMPETVSHAPTGSGKPEPLTPKTPLTFSYSQMVKRHGGQPHSKTTTKEIWKNIRSERTVATNTNTELPPVFRRSIGNNVAAVVFGFSGVRADLMHTALLNMDTGGQHLDFEEDRALIHFDDTQTFQQFLKRKVEVGGLVFRPQQTLFTTGKPLLIRAHHVTHATPQIREKALQDIFSMAGTIRHVDYQVVQSGNSTMTTPVVDFVLDITQTNPDQILIPRLANVLGVNCLFTWAQMGEICYQCGANDHVKARCTQQEGYARLPAILVPQLSPAFPPMAPKPAKQTIIPPALVQSVNYGPTHTSSLSSPSSLDSEWQTQGRKHKNIVKRSTALTVSDSETPPTSKRSHKKSKTTHETPKTKVADATKPKVTDTTKSKVADTTKPKATTPFKPKAADLTNKFEKATKTPIPIDTSFSSGETSPEQMTFGPPGNTGSSAQDKDEQQKKQHQQQGSEEGANPNGTTPKDTGTAPKSDLEAKKSDSTVTDLEKITDDKNPLQTGTETNDNGMDTSE